MANMGAVKIMIGGKNCLLCFDWKAIKGLKDAFGGEWQMILSQSALEIDTENMAKILSIGLEKYQPNEFSPEKVMEEPPFVVPAIDIIHKALNLAFYGKEESPAQERPTIGKRIKWSLKILFSKADELPFVLD